MLKNLKCPHCKSSNNLILFVNFAEKKLDEAVCFRKIFKPYLVRKFNKINSLGCGKNFSIKSAKR